VSVVLAWTVLAEGLSVFGGAIAFVLIPEIVGDLKVELIHKLVTVDFGQDGSGGNGDTEGISFNDWCLVMRKMGKMGNAITVDQNIVAEGELIKTLSHGDENGFVNAKTINDGNRGSVN